MKALAQRIINMGDEDGEEVAEESGKKSLLGAFDLKSLLAKKKSEPEAAAAD
jgi:pilus assembly protein CpaE